MTALLFCYFIAASTLWTWSILSGKAFQKNKTLHSATIKKYFSQIILLTIHVLTVLISAGFLAHQDTAWHQITNSTDGPMIARSIIYIVLYPAFIILGVAGWLHAKSHFPTMICKKMNIAFFVATFVPYVFLPAQDPEVVNLSADIKNIAIRGGYWVLMLTWFFAVSYIAIHFCRLIIESVGGFLKSDQ